QGLEQLIVEIKEQDLKLHTIEELLKETREDQISTAGGSNMVGKHTCKNGHRIVLESVSTVRSITIGIWVKIGSRNESEKLNGISHFLEHMFFKGTNTRSAQDIAEAFDSIGGQVNAFTSKEYTCYYARVLDTYKEYA